jgi:hypothetical protein
VNTATETRALHARFLEILPRIELHGRIYFRFLRSSQQKEEALAEMAALAWKWFQRLVERGKDPTRFPSALATFAARAVKSGRRLCGQERTKDALSPQAQQRHGFLVSRIPDYSTLEGNPFDEALRDNVQTPVPDQVAFRIDFPAWLRRLGQRNRRVAEEMALGNQTMDMAKKYGLSSARISQLRRELHADWMRFCDVPCQCQES